MVGLARSAPGTQPRQYTAGRTRRVGEKVLARIRNSECRQEALRYWEEADRLTKGYHWSDMVTGSADYQKILRKIRQPKVFYSLDNFRNGQRSPLRTLCRSIDCQSVPPSQRLVKKHRRAAAIFSYFSLRFPDTLTRRKRYYTNSN